MPNAIGSSLESNPSRRICHLRAVPLGHVADEGVIKLTFVLFYHFYVKSCVIDYLMTISVQTNKIDLTCVVRILGSSKYGRKVLAHQLANKQTTVSVGVSSSTQPNAPTTPPTPYRYDDV